jgi:hypothetical protein
MHRDDLLLNTVQHLDSTQCRIVAEDISQIGYTVRRRSADGLLRQCNGKDY